jgi:hypothetical protein
MCHAFNIESTWRHGSTRAVALLLSTFTLSVVSCSPAYRPPTVAAPPSCGSAPRKQSQPGSVSATTSIAPSPSSKPKPLGDDHPSLVDAGRLAQKARVVFFDCFSKKENKSGTSLRDWNGGGPNGAAWNIDGAPLACRITLDAPCTGSTELQIFGNKCSLGKATFHVIAGTSKTEVEILTRLWERAAESGKLNFATLLISVGGILVCREEHTNIYPFADAFIAGFAAGE